MKFELHRIFLQFKYHINFMLLYFNSSSDNTKKYKKLLRQLCYETTILECSTGQFWFNLLFDFLF